MLPFFGTILDGQNRTLYLPSILVFDFARQPFTATAGIYFNTSGVLQSQRGADYSQVGTDAWVHAESNGDPDFDASLYECGIFNVIGDTAYMLAGNPAEDEYHALTTNRAFRMQHDNLLTKEVTGDYRVREIANPSNEAVSTFTLRVLVEPFV